MSGTTLPGRLITLVRRKDRPVCVMLPGAGGGLTPYLRLASHLGRTHSVYAVRAAGLLPDETPEDTVARMADSAVDALGGLAPALVFGWSLGGTVAWDAKLTEDRPGEALAWQSIEGSLIRTRGRVTFARAPGRDMTEVRVEMQLGVLGINPGTGIARLFTRSQIKGDLRRLKQVLETGEVLISDASAHRRPHSAQPPAPGDKLQRSELPFIESPPTAAKGKTPDQKGARQ